MRKTGRQRQIEERERVRHFSSRRNPYYAYDLLKKHPDPKLTYEVLVKQLSNELKI